MKEYIEFQIIERKPKTLVYSVRNIRYGNEIGKIYWYGIWRSYIFHPKQNSVWSYDCLEKILGFLRQVNCSHKESHMDRGQF